jgi:hypothetical protein
VGEKSITIDLGLVAIFGTAPTHPKQF